MENTQKISAMRDLEDKVKKAKERVSEVCKKLDPQKDNEKKEEKDEDYFVKNM
ncbi:MAG: hypothetical protein MJ252_11595 [archaeon]|nr:hypothetical protein [archaeon]